MQSTTRTLLAAALVLGTAVGPAALPAVASASPSAVSARPADPTVPALEAAIANLPTSDATAALVRVGGTEGVWRGSSGVHDLRTNRPADPAARFRAGSVTKVFTAAVALQLVDEGRLDLNRSARSYLPELIPASYKKVTVRELLDHTHGIPAPDFPGDTVEEVYADRFRIHDPEDMVRSATAKKREFAPGTKQHYLNIGYTIAGLLIERVTGDSYERQVARRVLNPLGLRDTYSPGADPRIVGPHNHGYQTMRLDDGTTGLRDVTKDLFQGRVVRGPLLREMFTLPKVPDVKSGAPAAYSIGLSMKKLGGREVWGKTGGRWGYNTAIAATRDGSRTLVYSVNSTDAKGQDMNEVAMNIMVAAYGRP